MLLYWLTFGPLDKNSAFRGQCTSILKGGENSQLHVRCSGLWMGDGVLACVALGYWALGGTTSWAYLRAIENILVVGKLPSLYGD
jgi:hypothetical protein